MNKLKAVIFDMNGTVLEDEGLYTQSFRSVLRQNSIDQDFSLEKGISLYNNWKILVDKFSIDDRKIEDLVEETQVEYKKLINKIKIREGFFDLSDSLKSNNIKRTLATSNEKEITNFVFEHFSLGQYFDAVVTASDVNEVKPNPEIFLLAANFCSSLPTDAVVIEDAQAGVEAAKRGRFHVIGLEQEKHLKGVHMRIKDFTEINLDKLQRLVNR